mgnify:CR=1 FL=1
MRDHQHIAIDDAQREAGAGHRAVQRAVYRVQLELERLQSEMDQCIGCGCISLNHCLVINPGDELAAEGPGARRLLPFDEPN